MVAIAMLIALRLDPGLGAELPWLNLVFGVVCFGSIGLASALSPLWRVLVGLLVVTPLSYYAADVIRGAPDAWDSQYLPLELVGNALLTWMLPYLDPPAFVQRWVAHAPSRLTTTLRRGCVYIGYVCWLLVVCLATLLVTALVIIIAGFSPPVENVPPEAMRIGAAIMLAIEAILALLVWFSVRLWRRGKTGKPFPDTLREPSAPLPDFVADAVRDSAGKPL
jgi:hypothetical protein